MEFENSKADTHGYNNVRSESANRSITLVERGIGQESLAALHFLNFELQVLQLCQIRCYHAMSAACQML